MKAKENIIKALNSKWTMLFVLITFTSLMSSCVEGDLYDLYDEEDLTLSKMVKKTKTTELTYSSSIPGYEYTIADAVLHQTDCFYQAISYVFCNHEDYISMNDIEYLMCYLNNGSLDNFSLDKVLQLFTWIVQYAYNENNKNIEIQVFATDSSSSVSVGDIVFTKSTISSIMGQNNQSGNNGSNNLSSIIHAYVVGGISGDIVQSVDRGTYLCDLNKVYIDKYYRIIFQ